MKRNQDKLMTGIKNPINDQIHKIEMQQKNSDKKVHLLHDDTDLNKSSHYNFHTIYNKMFHGSKDVSTKGLEEERIKMGNDLKAMGQMRHKS